MNKILALIFIIASELLFAQTDTIVVNDYTKVMVSTEIRKGEVTPVTSLEGLSQAGFFIHTFPQGTIKLCNDGETYVWLNGKLIKKINGCDFFSPKLFYSEASVDTVFISFTTTNTFSNFECSLVRFEKLQIIQDEVLIVREARNSFSEFTIIALVIILGVLGLLIGLHPARVSYIIEKSFTFKTNTYEFINTNFISSPSLISSSLLALTLGFLSVYLNELLQLRLLESSQSTVEFLMAWIQFSLVVFFTLSVKRILIDLMSRLFYFKELKNYQLFDFINFNIFFFSIITFLVVLDFVYFPSAKSLLSNNILIVFPAVLIMFLVWFSLKFVNHSPRKKLIIISYLCATEIIPAVFLLSWFFK